MDRNISLCAEAVLGITVFTFWALLFPYDLMFQEQNQLFLFKWGFLSERLSVAGGLALWISEFLVQFFICPIAGAAIMAAFAVLIQYLVWKLVPEGSSESWYPMSFIPSALVVMSFGDVYSMLSHTVALSITLCTSVLLLHNKNIKLPPLLLASAALYWAAGPVFWLLTGFISINDFKRKHLLLIPWNVLIQGISYFTLMKQYPLAGLLYGVTYYRIPLKMQPYQFAAAAACLAVPLLGKLFHPECRRPLTVASFFIIAAASAFGAKTSFQKDTHTIVAMDQLVRKEQWDKLLNIAKKSPVKSELYSVDVNLALYMTSRTAEADDFMQAGCHGLIMPCVRDFISNTTSYEVFWKLGMINSCLRYAFDTQESLVNNQKSGRHMSRMVECNIVNGNYAIAEKYLGILSSTLFYRKFAGQCMEIVNKGVKADSEYGRLRRIRFREDFLYYYPQMDKMLYKLYMQNPDNTMAAYYYNRWEKYSE